MSHLAYVLQKSLLVSTELLCFRPMQQLTGLYSLILEGRQAPCKHSFALRRVEKGRKFSITVKVWTTCSLTHSERHWATHTVQQSHGKRGVHWIMSTACPRNQTATQHDPWVYIPWYSFQVIKNKNHKLSTWKYIFRNLHQLLIF